MATLLRNIPLALRWLPHIIPLIALVEMFGNRTLTGAQKKAAVLARLSAIAETSGLPWGDAAVQVVSQLIDTAVSVANFLGAFRKGDEVDVDDPMTLDAEPVEPGAASPAVTKAHVEQRKQEDPVLAKFLAETERK